MNWSKHL